MTTPNTNILLSNKLLIKLISLTILLFMCYVPVFAQCTVEQTQGFNFGVFYPTTGGYVQVDGSGRSSSGVVVLTSSTANVATFNVTEKSNNRKSYSVSILSTTQQILLTNSGNTLVLDLLAPYPSTFIIMSHGTQQISVGGRLNVPAGKPAGTYSNNSFIITFKFTQVY